MCDPGNAVHHGFDGNGDLLLNLLRRYARPLRDDVDIIVGHVGIGFDRQTMKRHNAPCEEQNAQARTRKRFWRAKSTSLRIIAPPPRLQD